jgi:general stress protein 26
MKSKPQQHESLARIADLVEGIDVCMLTTVAQDGKLLSRPMAALEICEKGHFWFFTGNSSAKTHQLSSLNLAFSDEDKSTYVSVSGSGEIVHDRSRIDELWSPYAKAWFPQGKDDPELALLKVTMDMAEYWDANSSRMVRLLALVASAVTGKPMGLGEHDIVHNPEALAMDARQQSLIV